LDFDFHKIVGLSQHPIEGRWKSLWCIHREFSYRSTGGRILKIGPHLPKLLTNIKRLTFF